MSGRWDEAAAAAHAVIAEPKATVIARIAALVALGRLRARRGDPGVWSALDEARDLAVGAGAGGFHVARAEAAWLEGRDRDAARDAAAHLPQAVAKRQIALAAQLSLWCRLGGDKATPIPAFCAEHPFALEAAGHWKDAADAWRALGCRFERARALSYGDEPAQRQALATFEELGAHPMVERVRRRLRTAGVRGLPRGPRHSTREHPAGLTSKELAVLELLAAGLRNKEIALRLHRSVAHRRPPPGGDLLQARGSDARRGGERSPSAGSRRDGFGQRVTGASLIDTPCAQHQAEQQFTDRRRCRNSRCIRTLMSKRSTPLRPDG